MAARLRNDKSCETVDAHQREKDFLTPAEVDQLIAATKDSRYRERDRAMVLVMFRHGLRVSELTEMRLTDLNKKEARLWVRRLKNGTSTHQPIAGDELRAIKRYLDTRTDNLPWLFVSERGGQLTRQAVAYICREDILLYAYALARGNAGASGVDGVTFEQIEASGVGAWLTGLREDLVSKSYRPDAARACLPNVHPHTLRHSCGYALANKGQDSRLIQDYLGHKNPTHTAHYTRTASVRFEGLWA